MKINELTEKQLNKINDKKLLFLVNFLVSRKIFSNEYILGSIATITSLYPVSNECMIMVKNIINNSTLPDKSIVNINSLIEEED